jgi:hypothetical protein
MNLDYERHDGFDPTAVAWCHGDERVVLEFPFPIRAVHSAALQQVVVELIAVGRLGFFDLDGAARSEEDVPELPGYMFWGLNPNRSSRTDVALLFQPVAEGVGNEWRDAEQYELVLGGDSIVGRKLGIYR